MKLFFFACIVSLAVASASNDDDHFDFPQNATKFNPEFLDVYLEPTPFDPPTEKDYQAIVQLVEPVHTLTEMTFLLYVNRTPFAIPLTLNAGEDIAQLAFYADHFDISTIGVTSESAIFVKMIQFDHHNQHFAVDAKAHVYCSNRSTVGFELTEDTPRIESRIVMRQELKEKLSTFKPSILEKPAPYYYEVCSKNEVTSSAYKLDTQPMPGFSTTTKLNANAAASLSAPLLYLLALLASGFVAIL